MLYIYYYNIYFICTQTPTSIGFLHFHAVQFLNDSIKYKCLVFVILWKPNCIYSTRIINRNSTYVHALHIQKTTRNVLVFTILCTYDLHRSNSVLLNELQFKLYILIWF